MVIFCSFCVTLGLILEWVIKVVYTLYNYTFYITGILCRVRYLCVNWRV